MKVKIHNLAIRIFPIAVSFCLIVSFLVYPAFAKVIDYNDYISNVSVNGDNDIVTVCLPADDMTKWEFKSKDGKQLFNTFYGQNTPSLSFPELKVYRIIYYPIDFRDLIDITQIPQDTVVNTSISIESEYDIQISSAEISVQYYDDNATLLTTKIFKNSSFNPTTGDPLTFSFNLSRPDGAKYIRIRYWFNDCNLIGMVRFLAGDLYFTMSINSLLRLQQETGRTNKLLEQVLDSLNQNSDGAAQDFQDSIVNQDQQLDQMAGIMDSIDRPDAGSINVSIDDYVSPSDMQNVSSILSVLFQSDLFLSMLMILLTMSVAAYVLFGKRG